MPKKQLKIALTGDLYRELQKAAKERNLAVSTYARYLLSESVGDDSIVQDDEVKSIAPAPRQKVAEAAANNEVILLSDVLKEDSEGDLNPVGGTSDEPAETRSNTLADTLAKSGVSISIVINK